MLIVLTVRIHSNAPVPLPERFKTLSTRWRHDVPMPWSDALTTDGHLPESRSVSSSFHLHACLTVVPKFVTTEVGTTVSLACENPTGWSACEVEAVSFRMITLAPTSFTINYEVSADDSTVD